MLGIRKVLSMKMKMLFLYCLIGILVAGNIFQIVWNSFANKLFTDVVPTEEIALEIGQVILIGMFGETILDKSPFNVQYDDNSKAWVIVGTLPDNYLGGVPKITIRKNDGRVLEITHGM